MSYRKLLAESQRKTYNDLDKYESSIGDMGGMYHPHYDYAGCPNCGGGGCLTCGGYGYGNRYGGTMKRRPKKKRAPSMRKKAPKKSSSLKHKVLSLVKQHGTDFIRNLGKKAKDKISSLFGFGLQKSARKKVYKPLLGNHCPPLSKLRKAELQILAKRLGIPKKMSKKMKVAELRAWLKKHCSEYSRGDIKHRVTKYKFKEPSLRKKKKKTKKRKSPSINKLLKLTAPEYEVPQYAPSMTTKVKKILSGFKAPKKFTLKLGQGLHRKLKRSCFY